MYVAPSDSSKPRSTVQRWNKDTEAKIAVPQSFLIDQYNKGMSGAENNPKESKWYAKVVW